MANKDVLTVCASGDHAFYSINDGAKSVDLFDINCLTKYYYCLRIWAIKYLNDYSLNLSNFHEYACYLLKYVRPKNVLENDCYYFWKLFLERVDKNNIFKLFNYGRPDNEIDNLRNLSKFIKKHDFSFFNIDISKIISLMHKKYDVLLLSNIHEYISLNDFWNFNCNIFSLLNDKGVAIISLFMDLQKDKKDVFEKYFDLFEIPEYDYCDENKCSIGYVLKKKVSNSERCK